ncbi:plasmid replication initiator TrfA [Thauera mechernichensis]|uniref:Plasmid replication initiator TrfA n=1 Tax=Thauera mechernichensis TaxID=82788 RepID=A0ABW3WJQ6_9RHOO|nr:plasmid replication initiator TrfA [Thauera mechernichensis]MDG3066007.1 plasmid replication initiator TrfA [Thauera mechernichensis]
MIPLAVMLQNIEATRQRRRQRDLAGRAVSSVPKPNAQLPLWPEPVRAVPNGFLRSALFGAIRKGRRRYLKAEQLAALDGIEIRYTGERLDQGDLDVWESVLHAVRLQELGSQCRVTSYALLKLMGKTDTGKNRATLHERITRLRANAVEVRQGRYCYIGGLIAGAAKDEETQQWVIELDAKLRPLFAADQFTQVEWAVRHALDGQPLAQWLHGFYASHANPFPLKVETLHRLCGSEATLMSDYAKTLRKALDAVAETSAAHGEGFSYDICGDLVHVKKKARGSQLRHLAKKAAKFRSRAG